MSKDSVEIGVLCDTSFFIRLNTEHDPLQFNARGYLKYMLSNGHPLYVSSIALAEYAVRDRIQNLPMKNFRVLPFNIDHAQRAGEMAKIVFEKRNQLPANTTERAIISNDTKMFAQADVHPAITHYLTADKKCEAVYQLVHEQIGCKFAILPLSIPHHQAFGELNLGD